MQDYLDEDPTLSNQKYAILSYVLSERSPMVKFRGAFSSIEECQNKIKKLQNLDSYFHMYVIEVGKWGALLTEDELNNRDISQEFRDSALQDMMKSYKEERDKANNSFEQRKVEMKRLAQLDGTKTGQSQLASQKEHPLSVKTRLDDTATLLKKLKEDLEEYSKIYDETKILYDGYSEEDLKQAEEDLKKLKID